MHRTEQFGVVGVLLLFGTMAGLTLAADWTVLGSGVQGGSEIAQTVRVYVTDFELAATQPRPQAKATSASEDKPVTSLVYPEADTPAKQAQRLIDFFGNTMVQTLQKNGYKSTRQAGNLPGNGVLLRGLFAEVDGQNRIRRAILGAGSPGTQLTLYVATFNLARQAQPLYLEAVVQAPDPRYGPVLTLNAYIPMAKYDMDKNPTEEDVRKICAGVVSGMTTLLNNNPASFSQ